MDYPKYGGKVYCKDTIIQSRQGYLCNICKYLYLVEQHPDIEDKVSKSWSSILSGRTSE